MNDATRSARLPFVQIDIDPGMPEPLTAARQIVGTMFDLDAPTTEVAENFRLNVTVYDLGKMQISSCRSSASILRRSKALVALTRVNHFIVQFYRTGNFHVTIDGERIEVPPGCIAFFDLARPGTIEADHVDNLSLTVPPEMLIPLVADPHGIHGLALKPDSEANAALTTHLANLWQRLPDLSPERAQEEAQSLAAMLAAAIGVQPSRRSVARAQLRKFQFGAICRWIDENLADPSLGPTDIIRKFYITRPTLYRMFEQRGGIMKYILERRLEKVFQELADRSRPQEKIGAIMQRAGLLDHTYAGRAFRSYFGVTPRQVRTSELSQMRWSPLGGTESFRIRNIERLGPLLEGHSVRVRLEDNKDIPTLVAVDGTPKPLPVT
jgi:AraC-like DNA-binding protein